MLRVKHRAVRISERKDLEADKITMDEAEVAKQFANPQVFLHLNSCQRDVFLTDIPCLYSDLNPFDLPPDLRSPALIAHALCHAHYRAVTPEYFE